MKKKTNAAFRTYWKDWKSLTVDKARIKEWFLANPLQADLDCVLKHAAIAEHCIIEVAERLERLEAEQAELAVWLKTLGEVRKLNVKLLRKLTGEARPDLDWNFWRMWVNLASASSHACESAADHYDKNPAEALEMLAAGDAYRLARQKLLLRYLAVSHGKI